MCFKALVGEIAKFWGFPWFSALAGSTGVASGSTATSAHTRVHRSLNPARGTAAAHLGAVVPGQVPLLIPPLGGYLFSIQAGTRPVLSPELPLRHPVVGLAVVPAAVPLKYRYLGHLVTVVLGPVPLWYRPGCRTRRTRHGTSTGTYTGSTAQRGPRVS